jgi:hypothetical protein
MRKLALAFLTLGICLSATSARAYDLEKKQFDLAVTTGILGSGNIDASWYSDFQPDSTISFNNEPSLMTRVMGDYYLTPYFAIGGALNYGPIIPQQDIVYEDNGLHTISKHDIDLLGYCVAFKGRFILNETMALKPGLYIGGWSSFSSSPEARESGVAINGSLELQAFYYENYYFLIDTGFFTQPYGGVQDIAYVRGGPIFYFNVGLGL